jgi:hypothetical protein
MSLSNNIKGAISGLCEQDKFNIAYKLNDRRWIDKLIDEETYENTRNWITAYEETGEKPKIEKKAMSAAERKAKSRAKAKSKGGEILGGIELTSKAADQLSILCSHTGLNKTQVINKLLEEQEQLKLL